MLFNLTRQATIAEKPVIAKSLWMRTRGMIGRKFDGFDALIFPQCNAVHTWFMGQALDLIFVDAQKTVLRIEKNVKPWKMIMGPMAAKTVIELPPGKLCGIPLERDDTLFWEEKE
jgi:uncharacterized protein